MLAAFRTDTRTRRRFPLEPGTANERALPQGQRARTTRPGRSPRKETDMPAPTTSLPSFLATTGQTALNGVARVASLALRIARNWLAKRTIARDFADLDDRMLRDIGLTRSDVQTALTAPALMDPAARLKIASTERRCAARASARERLHGAAFKGSGAASRLKEEPHDRTH
jgi:uncharacterized protein YjiS (DUF1127 family)